MSDVFITNEPPPPPRDVMPELRAAFAGLSPDAIAHFHLGLKHVLGDLEYGDPFLRGRIDRYLAIYENPSGSTEIRSPPCGLCGHDHGDGYRGGRCQRRDDTGQQCPCGQ